MTNKYDNGHNFIRDILNQMTYPAENILDIGCGRAIYKDRVRGRYIGTDIVLGGTSAGPRRVDVICDGQSLPFKDNSFDMVLCIAAIDIIPGTEKLVFESRRVLKDKGLFLIFVYNFFTLWRLKSKDNRHRHVFCQRSLFRILKEFCFRPKMIFRTLPQPKHKLLRLLSRIKPIYIIRRWKDPWRIIAATKNKDRKANI